MTIFEPYAHQVAGHCSIFKLDGRICKPLIPREYEFYKAIYREYPHLLPLIPEYHGTITIHINNMNQAIPISPSSPSSSPTSSTPSSTCTDYIVLQDLTAGMSKPCAMDMKIGTRQRFTTSTLLGFRLCGMRVHRWSGLYMVDRLFGRGLTPDTVEDAVAAFLFDGEKVRTELIPSILEGLQRIISILSDPSFPFRFYTSSLLFIYDGDQNTSQTNKVTIKMIDFAHAVRKTEKGGEDDDGVLFGLRNLSVLFQHIAARHDSSNMDVEEDDDNIRWILECAQSMNTLSSHCTPITPLLITDPMKSDSY